MSIPPPPPPIEALPAAGRPHASLPCSVLSSFPISTYRRRARRLRNSLALVLIGVVAAFCAAFVSCTGRGLHCTRPLHAPSAARNTPLSPRHIAASKPPKAILTSQATTMSRKSEAGLSTAPCLGVIRIDHDYPPSPGDIDSQES
eukprot:scaffold2189_cov57-Phaeocystis_antarctica.AAC.1